MEAWRDQFGFVGSKIDEEIWVSTWGSIVSEQIDSWERQKGETDKQWLAFRTYRDLGLAERTLGAAYRQTYDKPSNKEAPPWFRAWAKEFAWRDRVEAWDRHLDDLERLATEKERLDWRKHRRQVLRGFMGIIVEAIKHFDPTKANVGQITRAVDVLTQQMRAEMDDLPTEKKKVGGSYTLRIVREGPEGLRQSSED